MTLSSLPRVPLAHLPTPVNPLPRLSADLGGPKLWIKRDDQTGLAFGGNKTRKLEYLLAEAQAHGAKTLITRGAVQSNHCRQTAAAAAHQGLDSILVLSGVPPQKVTGNVLLDQLLGADLVWTEGRDPETTLKETFESTWNEGKRPYLIPYGGSNAVGASAYAVAMEEFLTQTSPMDRIVLATSSGGTQAGMMVGAKRHGFEGSILGISVDQPAIELKHQISDLANEIADLLQEQIEFSPDQIYVHDEYLGEGYGVMGKLEHEAITLFAQLEGVLLDPVYTARAAGGLIDLIRNGEIHADEHVLFWHTGGTPALFAYSDEFS
jgi:D-cysteine desulfhydrase family pyridoxal phosphate-dependent enzyme